MKRAWTTTKLAAVMVWARIRAKAKDLWADTRIKVRELPATIWYHIGRIRKKHGL